MSIQFINQTPFHLKNKRILKSFFRQIISNEAKILKSLAYILCTDDYLLNLNRKHLDHDYFTDILTFNMSGTDNQVEGEIYISIDRVTENAKIYKTLTVNELHRIMIHGILHLCGYKDKTASDKNIMTARENHYLKLLERLFHVKQG